MQVAKAFDIKKPFASSEELLKSDVDTVAIFTQRHLHGQQTLQALRVGKHVYLAVPMAQLLDAIAEIIDEVTRSELIYDGGVQLILFKHSNLSG